ncbi:MAG: hypothetical protein WC807_07675 [Hyphomicrobium sp.]|jgi:hypothetical protein
MIKLLGIGIWVCAVTLGAAFGVLEWQKGQMHTVEGKAEIKIEQIKTKAINVPIIGEGAIQGYMVAQFVLTVDGNALAKLPVDPQVYLLDEAFKTIYAGERVNFNELKRQDLPALAKMLGENVNKRLGMPIVQDVLIEQLAYIPKKDIREPPK